MGDLLPELKRLVVEALNLEDVAPEDIGDDTPLFGDDGLGLDSIDALELGVALHKKYRLKLDRDDQRIREHFRSVRTLAELVRAQGQPAA
jgi:acyl carrier protein